jgi:serine/threonine protein kinase
VAPPPEGGRKPPAGPSGSLQDAAAEVQPPLGETAGVPRETLDVAAPQSRAEPPGRPPTARPVVLPTPFSSSFLADYEPVKVLGQGGMGAVYLMRQARLDRLVAVKVILQSRSGDAMVHRFIREGKAMGGLFHPNIVAVFDAGEDGATPYMVMEYVDGETLAGRLRRRPQLALDATLRIAVEVLSGLGFAHDKGIVHRDLKPENLFLTREGRPKIGDFGLARHLDLPQMTRLGTIMGTPQYMSPEQCRGREAGPASDLYAFGAMLFEMVTGRLPFRGLTAEDTLRQHTDEPAPRARSLVPDLPERLDAILAKLLEKEPAQRFGGCPELARALADVIEELAGSRTATRAPARWDPAPGVKLADRYELVRMLGKGGMGQVWLARDTARGQVEVALKLLPRDLWQDHRARDDLVREANLALKLSHPNIVRLINIEPGEPPYLVMEYVPGQTLADDLAGRRRAGSAPRALPDATALLDQLAAGLDHAHGRGVVHRDIKPSNVLLEPDAAGSLAAAKLADFGVAAELASFASRQAGAVPTGTLAYMSPEQVECRPLDGRADVYSLAVTMFEVLTHALPFTGVDLARSILNDPVPEPAAVPPYVMRVLRQAMAREAADRPASASAFASMFRATVELVTRAQATPAQPARATAVPGLAPEAFPGMLPRKLPGTLPGVLPGTLAGAQERHTGASGAVGAEPRAGAFGAGGERPWMWTAVLAAWAAWLALKAAVDPVLLPRAQADRSAVEFVVFALAGIACAVATWWRGSAWSRRLWILVILAGTAAAAIRPFAERADPPGALVLAAGAAFVLGAAAMVGLLVVPGRAGSPAGGDDAEGTAIGGDAIAVVGARRGRSRALALGTAVGLVAAQVPFVLLAARSANGGGSTGTGGPAAVTEPDESLGAFERTLELEPRNVGALLGMADRLAALSRWDEASARAAEALRIDEHLVAARVIRGRAHLAAKRWEDAERELATATALDARHADAWYHRGQAQERLDRTQLAEASYQKALDRTPEHAEAQKALKRLRQSRP